MAKRCTTKRARRGLCTKKSTRHHGRRGRRIAPCGRKANGQIKSCKRGRR